MDNNLYKLILFGDLEEKGSTIYTVKNTSEKTNIVKIKSSLIKSVGRRNTDMELGNGGDSDKVESLEFKYKE